MLIHFLTFDGSQLTCLCVSSFIHLTIGSISNNFHQIKDAGRILESEIAMMIISGNIFFQTKSLP